MRFGQFFGPSFCSLFEAFGAFFFASFWLTFCAFFERTNCGSKKFQKPRRWRPSGTARVVISVWGLVAPVWWVARSCLMAASLLSDGLVDSV